MHWDLPNFTFISTLTESSAMNVMIISYLFVIVHQCFNWFSTCWKLFYLLNISFYFMQLNYIYFSFHRLLHIASTLYCFASTFVFEYEYSPPALCNTPWNSVLCSQFTSVKYTLLELLCFTQTVVLKESDSVSLFGLHPGSRAKHSLFTRRARVYSVFSIYPGRGALF